MVSNDPIKDYMRRHACGFPEALEALAAQLNRVQFETRSANLPKPPGGRPPDSKSMGFELDAV